MLPAVPPPPGHGRVVLDGVDGPMRVTAQADTTFVPPGASMPPTRTGELCASTPCAADLPLGRYTLYMSSADGAFRHGDKDELTVTEGLTYYRRAPGKYEPPQWWTVHPLSTILFVAGTAAISTATGLAIAEDEGLTVPIYVLLGGGVVLFAWGAVENYDASRAKQQQGATTTWKP